MPPDRDVEELPPVRLLWPGAGGAGRVAMMSGCHLSLVFSRCGLAGINVGDKGLRSTNQSVNLVCDRVDLCLSHESEVCMVQLSSLERVRIPG